MRGVRIGTGIQAHLDVDIADKMISQVVTDVHLFDFTVFIFELDENVFKEVIEMLLHFFFSHVSMRSIGRLRRILRIVIEVLEKDSLRESRLVVDTRAAIAVSARSNFEVKGTVDSENDDAALASLVVVHLCSKFRTSKRRRYHVVLTIVDNLELN